MLKKQSSITSPQTRNYLPISLELGQSVKKGEEHVCTRSALHAARTFTGQYMAELMKIGDLPPATFVKQTWRTKVRFYESFPCNEFITQPTRKTFAARRLGGKAMLPQVKGAPAAEVAHLINNLCNKRLKATENDPGNSRNTR